MIRRNFEDGNQRHPFVRLVLEQVRYGAQKEQDIVPCPIVLLWLLLNKTPPYIYHNTSLIFKNIALH